MSLSRQPQERGRLISTVLKPVASRIADGLGIKLISSGWRRADLLISDLDEARFAASRAKALRSNLPLCLILPGPLPLISTFTPTSFTYVVLEPDELVTASNAVEAATVALRVASERPCVDGDYPLLGLWRETVESVAHSAVATQSDSGTRSFQAVLAGEAQPHGSSPAFWDTFVRDVVDEGHNLDGVLEAVLQDRTVFFDPYDNRPIDAPAAFGMVRLFETCWQENDRPVHCYGAQYWNHPSIAATFRGKGGKVVFHESEEELLAAAGSDKGRIVSWAGRTDAKLEAACKDGGIDLLRIEDGFLRSVGLGAGLAPGAMLAVDDQGIYYDPSRPSRLETLLQTYEFSDAERARGDILLQQIVVARVSKYNVGATREFAFPSGKRVLLVPGQVADDAAIRKSESSTIACATTPNVNLDLLRLARERNSDAFIVFKPHPDVETGLRKGKLTQEETARYADHVALKTNIIDLIEASDEVETFSSLSGFEALLRGKAVTTHGLPFYAGWGLSDDLTASPRRTVRRTLPELVYLALVVYARSIDPITMLPCTPEFLITRLSSQRQNTWHNLRTTALRQASWLGRKLGL